MVSNYQFPCKHICEGYVSRKMQWSSFSKDGAIEAICKLPLVQSDMFGLKEYRHSIITNFFIDDHSKHSTCMGAPIEEKPEVFGCFKKFIAMRANTSRCKMSTLSSNRGEEYMSEAFHAFNTN